MFIVTCNWEHLVVGGSMWGIDCWLLVVGLLLLIGGWRLVSVPGERDKWVPATDIAPLPPAYDSYRIAVVATL